MVDIEWEEVAAEWIPRVSAGTVCMLIAAVIGLVLAMAGSFMLASTHACGSECKTFYTGCQTHERPSCNHDCCRVGTSRQRFLLSRIY